MINILWVILALITLAVFGVCIDSKISEKKEKQAESRLLNSLKSICSYLSIPVTYHDDLGIAAGQISYCKIAGKVVLDDSKIQILTRYQNEPWTLAHEIGHYMELKQKGETSEDGADYQALCLCKSILTQQEQAALSIALHCYLGEKRGIE